MKRYLILLLLFVFASCSKKKKVYIIKQWHLSPNEVTTDILKSKTLPQFDNQIDIYRKALKLLEKNSKAVIAEGCEGEITKDFQLKFNGWSIQDLIERKDLSDYEDILAPVPMKLKAKFGDTLKVVCGDNNDLIKKNNLAFSDTKAFSGFFQRLFHYQNNDQKLYEKYLKAFKEVVTLKEGEDPVAVAKRKTLESLSKFGTHIETRNLYFLKQILKQIEKNPILIVGGLHVPGIVKQLKEGKIDYEIITPVDYPQDEGKLFVELKKALDRYEGRPKPILNQVPDGFDMSFIKLNNLIPIKKLATKKEWEDLKKLAKRYDFNVDILRVDRDKDGIRDFTISTSPSQVIITAEDPDWDNDGVPNIIDSSIGKDELFKISYAKLPLKNNYQTTGLDEAKILGFYSKIGLKLLESKGAKHDLLILKIFTEVLRKMKLDPKKLKFLHATKPSFTYGKQVFFAYVKGTKTIEIYPDKLHQYLAYKKENDFKGADARTYFNGYVTPLVIHSAAHEIAHSIPFDVYEFAKKNGWEWEEQKVKSKYAHAMRDKDRVIDVDRYNYKYVGLTYAQWLEQHKLYLSTVNDYLKKYPKDKEFLEKVKELKWYTPTDSKQKEYQVSFLVNRKIPSLYAMSQPKEWIAELIASCVFRKFYPKSTEIKEAIRYELTIGLNPTVSPDELCKFF